MSEVLPLASLQVSGPLAAADPAAIAGGADALAAAAGRVRSQSDRLGALRAGLTGGLWVSSGAAAFARAAQEHARRLGVVAALMLQLADAMRRLAAALASARDDALAVAAGARRLDAQAEILNARIRTRRGMPGGDPQLAADVAALRQQMVTAADRLQGAQWRAEQAWQRARAEFDLAGYATPAMRQLMQSAAWDPAAGVSLAAAGARSCGPMDELGLPRGGVIQGPDGRRYALVVQTARDRDGRLLVTTEEVPAKGGGWQQLAVRYGTTAYGRKAQTWDKVAVALGGAAGAAYPEGSKFDPTLLGAVHFMPAGGAFVPSRAADREPAGLVREAPAEPPRAGGQASRYWSSGSRGLAAGRRAGVPDAIGLVDGALGGLLAATHLDDSRAAAYRVVFEENGAGERRARLQLYRVVTAPGEAPATVAAGGYADRSGRLAGLPVTGEDPDRPFVMRPAGR